MDPSVQRVLESVAPPPVLPDPDEVLRGFLLRPESLPIYATEATARAWHRTPRPERLLQADMRDVDSTLKVDRDPATGKSLSKRRFNQNKISMYRPHF